ncbi:ExeA family protein [Thermodesulfatator autotrophicus]|uniref:AAA+ ATPase domain-containing protein n=1 Tax=Thermodesulfatator autotrophicus TaxID=1795632 RepID=A0A177EA48_9BACT|nr:AAA family ATPase [Thermodesulfatator autotrophicus]OAG28616.1 hypothetical protein TH606_00515 [Thermodesulfatator autotrophicus]
MTQIPDYLDFFALKDHPFRLTPDTSYFFPSYKHQGTLEVLRYALARGEGFLILTGEPGTGKTLILRLLVESLPKDKETAFILSPTLNPKELLEAILEDLDIETSASETKEQLLRKFKDHLLDLAKKGKTLVLIVDEAQNLPIESLEELRLLSNLETEKKKLIQILLVGQPGLKDKLKSPELSQLLQRISVWEKLEPLSPSEVVEYINFRWHKAGGIGLNLDKRAYKLLYRESQGIPRLINKIMDRAVLVAAAENKKKIDENLLKDALNTLDPYDKKNGKIVFFKVGILFLSIIIICITCLIIWRWWLK